MSVFGIVALAFGGVVIYVVIGAVLAELTSRYVKFDSQADAQAIRFLLHGFWPIVTPLFGIVLFAQAARRGFAWLLDGPARRYEAAAKAAKERIEQAEREGAEKAKEGPFR